jgi:beta-N-acetylhexosaminidase
LSFTDAAVLALNAGCDLVPLCNQSVQSEGGRAIDELLDGLAQAQEEGRWEASQASEERRLALLPRGSALSWDALMSHPDYMHALDLLP